MAPNTSGDSAEIHEIHYDVKKLPSWSKLNDQIREIEKSSTWMERYGWDWMHILVAAAMIPGALKMLAGGSILEFITGTFILGLVHCVFAHKSSHLAAHNALCDSTTIGYIVSRFLIEFMSSYSHYMGIHSHVKMHHPHTNIIGLGDSSVWKMPQLTRIPYMFLAPFLMPVATPIVAAKELIEHNLKLEFLKFLLFAGSGLIAHVYVLMQYGNFTLLGAICFLFTYRSVTSVPWIHINIFQHIGLPMYSNDHRPARIYQMASGVLNLNSNMVLDHLFGHSLISCHVQHHLFPRLSDHMCKKVEKVVHDYLVDNGLPYHVDSYTSRLDLFVKDYDRLMVKAPPITQFIGIQ